MSRKLLSFVLLFGSLFTGILPSAAQEQWLTYGSSTQGHIADKNNTYKFTGNKNDLISIYASADDERVLDLALQLKAPDGQIAVENDDMSLSSVNPAIVNFQLTQDGQYTIYVIAKAGQGDYTLRLEGKGLNSTVLWDEKFKDNTNDWWLFNKTTTQAGPYSVVLSSQIADNAYQMDISAISPDKGTGNSNWFWMTAPGTNKRTLAPDLPSSQHYSVEATIRKVQSRTGNYLVGILFHQQPGYLGYSAFTVTQEGSWTIVACDEKQNCQTVASAWLTHKVDFLTGTHTIGVDAHEGVYKFWVDDQYITKIPWVIGYKDDGTTSWKSGSIGLVGGTFGYDQKAFVHIEFSEVIVKNLD